MLFILVREVELLEENQVSDRASSCVERLEDGVQYYLLVHLLIDLTQSKIVDLVHVSFIHILISKFLMNGLVEIIFQGR